MASPEIQNLSRQLLLYEASRDHALDERLDATACVIEQLRVRLVRLAGVDGFRSLLSRALALAEAESPSLGFAKINPDDFLHDFNGIGPRPETEPAEQAGCVLVAHLLELLVTFIGESLTLHLVREAWPDVSLEGTGLSTEGKP